jgi:hypothetical protein
LISFWWRFGGELVGGGFFALKKYLGGEYI